MNSRIQKLLKFGSKMVQEQRYNFHFTPVINTFWVRDKKGGYKTDEPLPPLKTRIVDGFTEMRKEFNLFIEETKDFVAGDPIMVYRPGETDIEWDFKKEQSLNNWIISCDKDHNEGYSSCALELSNHNKCIFRGSLSTRLPKDGKTQRAGYCNMTTKPFRKSFKREKTLNWGVYNILVMKVRGDGRSYFLNIGTKGYYDISWNDMYHYILFTRGGPYWQTTRIPFSKFVFSSRGRIQDKQWPINLEKISSFGITMADKVEGDFSLEIDYIGLEFDPNHTEEFAYEMYQTDANIAAS